MYASTHCAIAILGGLVATHLATNMGMWFHGLGLPDLNFNILNGYLVMGNSANAFGTEGFQDPAVLTLFGAAAHYTQGVAFSLIFALAVFPLIPLKNSLVGNILKAVIWGFILATLSAVWWVPALFSGLERGIFFSNFGPNQIPYIIALYLWHFIYGFNLGVLFNPAPAAEAEVVAQPAAA